LEILGILFPLLIWVDFISSNHMPIFFSFFF
jgi:hypothetical protein